MQSESSRLRSTKTDRSAYLRTFVHDHLLLLLIGLRLVNALTLRTFFQPDEYYQALEPAWWLAFGDDSGAWLTWVSKSKFRTRHVF